MPILCEEVSFPNQNMIFVVMIEGSRGHEHMLSTSQNCFVHLHMILIWVSSKYFKAFLALFMTVLAIIVYK